MDNLMPYARAFAKRRLFYRRKADEAFSKGRLDRFEEFTLAKEAINWMWEDFKNVHISKEKSE